MVETSVKPIDEILDLFFLQGTLAIKTRVRLLVIPQSICCQPASLGGVMVLWQTIVRTASGRNSADENFSYDQSSYSRFISESGRKQHLNTSFLIGRNIGGGLMKQRKAIIAILVMVFLICIGSTMAAKIVQVSHNNIKAEVLPGEVGQYEISIKNGQDIDDTFYISVDDMRFALTLLPITDFTGGMKAKAGETVKSMIYLVPSDKLRIGEYNIRVVALSKKTNAVYSDILSIYVAPKPVEKVVIPDVTTTVSINPKIDPRIPLDIEVSVQNNNALDLGNVLVEAKSGLFSKQGTISLGSNGSDSISFKINLDKNQMPRTDLLVVSVSKDNRFIDFQQKDIEIMELKIPFNKGFSEENSFLKTKKTISIENNGNVKMTETIKEQMPFYRRWFTKSTPDYMTEKDSGKKYMTYAVTLEPKEKKQIIITTSYRMLLLFAVLAIIGIIIYYSSRSPLVVLKRAQIIQKKEGGISRLKIFLHIKNRTKHVFDDVRVVDKVQKIAKLIKEEEHIGTVKPNRVVQKKNEALIEWKIPKLEGGEERIIIYKVESRLSILGDFKLRKALVEYSKDNVRGKTYSNEFYVEM